jgi:predicted transcriptional regulator
MKATKAELGELERAVMKIVWANNSLSAEAIREKLDRGLKETTVRTVLRRLEAKGYVGHKVENRTFMYEAAEPRRKVAARAIKRIVDWFCDGSVDEVLVGLVDAKMVDRAQVDRLLTAIEQAEQQSKDSPPRSRSKKGARP